MNNYTKVQPVLRKRITINEQEIKNEVKSTVCSKMKPDIFDSNLVDKERNSEVQVLVLRWNFVNDEFSFDINNVLQLMMQPTKRNVVSLATRFFDPLGVLSPITIRFKIFFQKLCQSKIS